MTKFSNNKQFAFGKQIFNKPPSSLKVSNSEVTKLLDFNVTYL